MDNNGVSLEGCLPGVVLLICVVLGILIWPVRIYYSFYDVGKLSQLLLSSDSSEREAAARCLSKKVDEGDAIAVPVLITALSDSLPSVRKYAVISLWRIGDIRAVEPLIIILNDEEWQVREAAAKALGSLGDIRAVEALVIA
jgi:HEAT repeat protein